MADRPATTSKKAKKKPGRKRRVAGWLLLVIGVLIAGVWGASGWWTVQYKQRNWWMALTRGKVRVTEDSSGNVYPGMPDGWTGPHAHDEPGIAWRAIDFQTIGWSTRWDVVLGAHGVIPRTLRMWDAVIWPFALASLLGGGWLVWSGRRARRRAMTGLCRKCGYDLRGLLGVGALCPECGDGGERGVECNRGGH